MPGEDANINVIRTVWRKTKKGNITVRDLQPEKEVKGGGGVAGTMKTLSSFAEAPLQTPTERERQVCEDAINKAHFRFLRWLRKSLRR
jgi:hypothetical protein